MKRISFFFLALVLVATACQNSSSAEAEREGEVNQAPEETAAQTAMQAQEAAAQDDPMAASIRNALRNDLLKGDLSAMTEEQRRFAFERYDLNDDGKDEYLVGFGRNSYFCGSGGCTYMLLDHEGNLITRFTVADAPFVVLSSKHNGWHDLAVESDGKMRELVFNGRKYPSNPSLAPAMREIPGDGLPRLVDPTLPLPMYDF